MRAGALRRAGSRPVMPAESRDGRELPGDRARAAADLEHLSVFREDYPRYVLLEDLALSRIRRARLYRVRDLLLYFDRCRFDVGVDVRHDRAPPLTPGHFSGTRCDGERVAGAGVGKVAPARLWK